MIPYRTTIRIRESGWKIKSPSFPLLQRGRKGGFSFALRLAACGWFLEVRENSLYHLFKILLYIRCSGDHAHVAREQVFDIEF